MPHAGGPNPKISGEVINEAAVYVEEWREEHIAKATVYIQKFVDRKTILSKKDDHYPTIEGLALQLDVSRETIYAWAETYPEFKRIVTRLHNKQADQLQNGGLNRKYDSGVSKLLLSKHGYVQKSEGEMGINFNKDGKAAQYLNDD